MALEGGEWSAAPPCRSLPPGKDPVTIVQKNGWAPGPVWTRAENLAPTGIRSPDRPARSQSLYRLSHPAHRGRRNLYIIELVNFRSHNSVRLILGFGRLEFEYLRSSVPIAFVANYL